MYSQLLAHPQTLVTMRLRTINPVAWSRRGSVLLLAAGLFTGCMTTRIATVPGDCAAMANDPHNQAIYKAYWWGLQTASPLSPPCDPRANHLNAVEVRTSFGQYVLAGVTLGIVQRRTVRWCCTPYRPDIPDVGPRPPK